MEFLRPLTIEVDFVKGGRTQYLATTWVGYVGVLTGTSTLSHCLSRAPVKRETSDDRQLLTRVSPHRHAPTRLFGLGELLRNQQRILEERQEGHPPGLAHRYTQTTAHSARHV
jgi:hypothetical protein